jgi:hypothetical protein
MVIPFLLVLRQGPFDMSVSLREIRGKSGSCGDRSLIALPSLVTTTISTLVVNPFHRNVIAPSLAHPASTEE